MTEITSSGQVLNEHLGRAEKAYLLNHLGQELRSDLKHFWINGFVQQSMASEIAYHRMISSQQLESLIKTAPADED